MSILILSDCKNLFFHAISVSLAHSFAGLMMNKDSFNSKMIFTVITLSIAIDSPLQTV